MNNQQQWATIQVIKMKGGRSLIVNTSQRGLFYLGERYYNHRLKMYPDYSKLNITIRLSKCGRRMVQEIKESKCG